MTTDKVVSIDKKRELVVKNWMADTEPLIYIGKEKGTDDISVLYHKGDLYHTLGVLEYVKVSCIDHFLEESDDD